VYSRRPFRLPEHLLRLQHSLDGIRLRNPHTDSEWGGLLEQIIARNDSDDQYLYLHVTRGVARRDHAFPKGVSPTVFIMSNPLLPPPAELLTTGAIAITAEDNRWLRCDIKGISLLPNVLLRQMAIDVGAMETVLLRSGFMTEGAASNIFVVKKDLLLAPPKNHLMLPGITYDVVLELAKEHGITHEVRAIAEHEVRTADELLLTSSTKEIMPITRLDGRQVGDGRPGIMFSRLYRLYQEYKDKVMRGGAINTL
jgi:D-alanine transaminase